MKTNVSYSRKSYAIGARWIARLRWYLTVIILVELMGWSVRAQMPPHDQLIGTWIGVHSELDIDFTCPLPTYIQLDADSTYWLGMVDGTASPQRSTWGFRSDSLRLGTNRYAPGLITLRNDVLRIGTVYPLVFRRFTDVPTDSSQIHRLLAGKVWRADSLLISLFANGKAGVENTLTRMRTAHFWQLARLGSSVFLIVRGNQFYRDGDYKFLWQVVGSTARTLTVLVENGHEAASRSLALVGPLSPTDSFRPSGFQTCDNCFRKMWYGPNALGLTQRRYDLQKLLANQFKPLSGANQSGILRIEFAVNCNGESGLLAVQGFGDDYCPRTFDTRIVTQLYTLCRQQLASGRSLQPEQDPANRPRDLAVTVTFRLKDGQVTNIIP